MARHRPPSPLASLLALAVITTAVVATSGCDRGTTAQQPPPPPEQPKGPPVTVAAGTAWVVAPAALETPAYHNRPEYVLSKLPPALAGAWVVQRAGGHGGDTGPLAGKVVAARPCTAYVAVMSHYLDKEQVTAQQFAALAAEGWAEVPGEFRIREPGDEVWRWRVWSRPVEPGPVDLRSQAVPVGGVYFFK